MRGAQKYGYCKRVKMAVCGRGGLLAGSVADGLLAGPERPQAEIPGKRPALLRQGPVPGGRNSIPERDPGRRAFRRGALQALSGGDEATAMANRLPGARDHDPAQTGLL